jgi:hypothetical protein
MAQTISIQRGSVTFTARGDDTAGTSNNTTLFTNTSSGSGTRVIINYLTVQNPYVSTGGISYTNAKASGLLASVSAGTTGTIIGAMQTGSTTGTYQMGIMDAGSPVATGNTSVFPTPPRFRTSIPNLNQVGFSNTSPSRIGFDFSDTTNFAYCPRNFWIGPSDVIRWYPKDSYYTTPSGKSTVNNYYTQTLYYSFTCITES